MSTNQNSRAPLRKLLSALIVSVVFNFGIIAGLGSLHAQDPMADPTPQTIVPMSIVEPPPPPPPTEQEDQSTNSLPAQASALPPLELPPSTGNMGAIEVPQTNTDEFGWALDLSMPSFSGKGAAALQQNIGREASSAILLYQPDLANFYPGRARRAQITGKTKLTIELSAKGEVTKVIIISSTPEGVFERAARRAAKRLRYKPSVRNGRPQSSKVSMEFIWKLD